MRRLFWAVLLCLLYAAPALAQVQPTAYTFRIFQGSTLIGTPLTVPAANVPCDLAPATGTNLNPTRWRFADVAKPGRECEFPDSARLAALADGDYTRHGHGERGSPESGDGSGPFRAASATDSGCTDGSKNYQLGQGPPVIRMPNGSDAQRATWLAMIRAWEARRFRVDWSAGVEMTSPMTLGAYVYLVPTCSR